MFKPKELFRSSFEEIRLSFTVEANHTGSWEIGVDFNNLAISGFVLYDKSPIVKMKVANFSCSIEHNQKVIGESNANNSFFVVILREFSKKKENKRTIIKWFYSQKTSKK